MSTHEILTPELGIHGIVSRVYANAAERLAATLYSDDVGRVAKDSDTGRLWLLRAAPGDWLPLDGGAVDVPFAQAVLFSSANRLMPQQTVAGALAFTVNAAGAVKGGSTYVELVSNGANTPTFAGMVEHGSSMGYDGRPGIVNQVEFWYTGSQYRYSISQDVGAVPTVLPSVRFSGLFSVVESGDGTAGWTYANTGSGTAVVTTPDKSLAASASGEFSFLATGHTPATMNSPFIGFTLTGAAGAFTQYDWCMYGEQLGGGGTGKYKCLTQGGTPVTANGDANISQAPGDMLRARRSGTSLIFEVSKNGGSSWTAVHTFAASTAKLYPQIVWTGPGTASQNHHVGMT